MGLGRTLTLRYRELALVNLTGRRRSNVVITCV